MIYKSKEVLRKKAGKTFSRYLIEYKPMPYTAKLPEDMIRMLPELAASYYTMKADTAKVAESNEREMLELQKDYAQQLEAKGIVTYEVEVGEDYDEEKDYAPLNPPGRRRHRPGVMKNHQGETRKLN
ncbi:hypothetical protein VPH35_093419 [Triticum aestivum]|uniref:Uncharacterized protein n=1 Tax=Triticum turgidum subsp. durum TaxID=4567 RepID=A0A9R0XKS4_TRITD|nr:unnamed protein product [Triticum turgidum subsp. durum]